jgi:hypothetical protein
LCGLSQLRVWQREEACLRGKKPRQRRIPSGNRRAQTHPPAGPVEERDKLPKAQGGSSVVRGGRGLGRAVGLVGIVSCTCCRSPLGGAPASDVKRPAAVSGKDRLVKQRVAKSATFVLCAAIVIIHVNSVHEIIKQPSACLSSS